MRLINLGRWFWALLVGVVLGGTLLLRLPTTWVAYWLAQAPRPALWLCHGEGPWWQGSAELFLVSATGASGRIPGRISWRVQPEWNGLKLALSSTQPEVFPVPLELHWGLRGWRLDAARARFPAAFLLGWGAPFNTLGLEGELELQWSEWAWDQRQGFGQLPAALRVNAPDLSSRLSPLKPLGSYRVQLTRSSLETRIDLQTERGPLWLKGQGSLAGRRWSFDGEASSNEREEPALVGLLAILGRRTGQVTHLHY